MNGVTNLSLVERSQMGEIAFIDLKAQQKRIRARIEKRFSDILDHGRYIAGAEIEEFEERLAAYTGASAAVACASGTAALVIALLGQDLEEGDAVFLPAFTYNATANAVLLSRATPVFVDIDPQTLNMDPVDLAARLEQVKQEGRLRPRGIVPVDLFGAPADYSALSALAEREGLFIVADGAQSFGGELDGRQVGAIAPVTTMSFFPGKALGAYGDAGAVLHRDESVVEHWRSILWHGTDAQRKTSVQIGFNGRMDSFQAAVLLEKLSIADDEIAARRRVANYYNERLAAFARPQKILKQAQSGYNYYSVRTENRDGVAAYLKELGVPTAIYYPIPMHQQPPYREFPQSQCGLAVTTDLCQRVLALPMHPYLDETQQQHIAIELQNAL